MSRTDRRKARPMVEGIEDRICPVGFFTRAQTVYMELQRDHALATQSQRVNVPAHPALSGTVRGTFTLSDLNLNANTSASVVGSGTVRPLGSVSASGQIAGLGKAGGRLQGDLTLSQGQGSVVLHLTATAPKQLDGKIHARVVIVGGTGAFANLRGSGSATIQLGPFAANGQSGSFSATIQVSHAHH